MFESLTQRLSGTIDRLRGRGRLTEENIREATREVRIALLEADVALPVVQALIERIKVRAVGQEVLKSLTPGQALIKVVRDELAAVMGSQASELNLNVPAPAVVLMAGLQGAGKTTTVAKLARHLKEKRKKKVMVVSADVYRPAAIEQLQTLARQVDVLFFPSEASQKPEAIVRAAIDDARKSYVDVLIVDTAGRTSIDDAMMSEIKALHAAVDPVETLFVVDSMTGQDAAVTAKHFGEALPLTGVVLTKTDGDARGGAALSVRYITGKPIKFVGTGEKTDGLDVFHPARAAGRILDMEGTGWTTADLKATWRPEGPRSPHILSFGVHYDLYNLVSPTYNTADWISGGHGSLFTDARGKTEAKAIWFQDVWRFAPRLRATLGARYEQWRAFDGFNFTSGTAIAQPGLDPHPERVVQLRTKLDPRAQRIANTAMQRGHAQGFRLVAPLQRVVDIAPPALQCHPGLQAPGRCRPPPALQLPVQPAIAAMRIYLGLVVLVGTAIRHIANVCPQLRIPAGRRRHRRAVRQHRARQEAILADEFAVIFQPALLQQAQFERQPGCGDVCRQYRTRRYGCLDCGQSTHDKLSAK